MNPYELAKSGTEHGEQRALFAWSRMAEEFGFQAAWNIESYTAKGLGELRSHMRPVSPVPELHWYHAIPNGGARGDDAKTRAIRGGQLVAEGVKKGIPDTFLPLPMWGNVSHGPIGCDSLKCVLYCGLYIEMKREKSEGRKKGSTSTEQDDAIAWLRHSMYAVSICFTWDGAARDLQSYIEAVRKGGSNNVRS